VFPLLPQVNILDVVTFAYLPLFPFDELFRDIAEPDGDQRTIPLRPLVHAVIHVEVEEARQTDQAELIALFALALGDSFRLHREHSDLLILRALFSWISVFINTVPQDRELLRINPFRW